MKLVLKKIPFDVSASDRDVRDLVNEVSNGAILCHPNIVRLHGVFIEGRMEPALCLVMRYAEGGTLEARIERQRQTGMRFDSTVVRMWITQLASAVSYMHRHNVLHRDLSARNIFCTGPSDDLLVGDFGLSKRLDLNTLSKSSGQFAKTQCGTLAYMAPEIINGGRYGPPADVWAVGALVFEILSLHQPFDMGCHNLLVQMKAIADAAPTPAAMAALDAARHPHTLRVLVSSTLLLHPDPAERMNLDMLLKVLQHIDHRKR